MSTGPPNHLSDREMRAAERAHDRSKGYQLKLLDAATRDAQEAMKVALAINGGAAVAVLTFSGAVAYKGGIGLAYLIYAMISLGLFAAGVLLAAHCSMRLFLE